MIKKQIDWHWNKIYIEIGRPWFLASMYKLPLINIRKDAFDFLWLGFQITWRYLGNATDCFTGLKVKDQYKTQTQERST